MLQRDRVEQMCDLIDKVFSDTVTEICSNKVYDSVIPRVEEHILKTYGPLPKVIEIHDNKEVRTVTGIFHERFETILKLVSKDIPVYLSGEAGTGKNVICKQISEALGLPFYFTNAVTQEYKLTGFIDANGIFHETQFYKAFKDGGLFFLDELDASVPEVLVILNAAIANRYFDFPIGKIEAHPNFRIIAAGNTFGTGANDVYSGRFVLDGASLDRFSLVTVPYSKAIEKALTHDNKELLDFCYDFRKISRQAGIRTIFSYRGLKAITMLENDMPIADALGICLTKGMSKDDISTIKQGLNSNSENKYVKAFLKL